MDLAATSGVLAPSQSRSSSRELNYPPLYAFPPFFTLQPNATTLATQLAQWSNLVLAWCRHHRAFVIDVEATSGADIDSLWQNKSIDRRLDVQSRRKVLESMVNDGNASWEPKPPTKPKPGTPAPTRALVYWTKPEEWGDKIHQWVWETGQNGSIMTFFELTEGDAVQDTEFANLPVALLKRALDSLVRQGKAQVFEGTDGIEGVKFS